VRLEASELVVVRAGRRVLDGASVAIASGEIASIEGASGGGKTTLLRALATLIAIDGGSLRLDGVDAEHLDPRAYRRRVAYVPQRPPMLEGTVEANVAAGPRLRGERLEGSRVRELLLHVGLDVALVDRVARELSGGEQQRLALARALANEPELLLLDEPTSALDPEAAARVIERVRALAGEGLGILVVTHQAAHARALGGTRRRMLDGRLAEVVDVAEEP
jgi:putative ABC transport system ATP-binding protein